MATLMSIRFPNPYAFCIFAIKIGSVPPIGICEQNTSAYGNIKDSADLEENLRNNCIPEEVITMNHLDYPAFLEKRRQLMAQKMRRYYESL